MNTTEYPRELKIKKRTMLLVTVAMFCYGACIFALIPKDNSLAWWLAVISVLQLGERFVFFINDYEKAWMKYLIKLQDVPKKPQEVL
jgi:hypothetical protein